MINERLSKCLNGQGKKLILLSIMLTLLIDIIGYLLIGKNIIFFLSTTGKYPKSLTVSIFIFLQAIITIFITSALYSSSVDILNDRELTYKTYYKNGLENFWGTFAYFLRFGFLYFLIIAVPVYAMSYLIYSNVHIDLSRIDTLVVTILLNLFAAPVILLKIVGKEPSNFVKKNWKPLIIVSIIKSVVAYIPFIGALLSVLLDVIYTLLILSLHKDIVIEYKQENSIML